MGDYYLTKPEKESLGIGRVLFGSVRAAMRDLEAVEDADSPDATAG